MKTIGIVGGVGPFAGLALHHSILKNHPVESEQNQLSVIHINAAAEIPDRTGFLLGISDQNPCDPIISQIAKLIQAGAEVIGIPCNTAHSAKIINPVKKYISGIGSRVLFIDMIEETINELSRTSITDVGLMATSGTYLSKVYQISGSRINIEIHQPSDQDQKIIHDCIYNREYGIKALGYLSDQARERLDRVIDRFKKEKLRHLIAGCTELALVYPDMYREVTIVNTIDILARALIAEATKVHPTY